MKKLSFAAALFAALVLAACQSGPPAPPPPYPTPPPPAPVLPPPLAGTAGPLTPTGVGRYMDALERDLRARLRGQGVGVARRGDEMLLTFPNDRLFAGMALHSAGLSLLASVAQTLRYYDRTQMQVNGYTDTLGHPEQNLTLSQKRTALVGDALVQDGVAEARIEVHGFGATNLKIMTGDNVSEPRNRRIEVRIQARPG